jgi:UDP-2,3-diacylglucosamine pyrophosphatase LpxH
MKYRSIFISDVHLGLQYSRVKELIDFLKQNECDTLYLVGDIVDGWALRRKWYWNNDYNLLIQKILRKSRKGTRIVYIPGNHDEFFREFGNAFNLGNIEMVDRVIHISPNGKKYLVVHGDIFDGILNSMSFISKLGSFIYDIILYMNAVFNKIRRSMGMEYWSLSHYIKVNTKEAVKYCVKYEKAMVSAAIHEKVDGVICGHVHYPCQKIINGIEYHNTGCWIELATAIVEHEDGKLELIDLDCYKLTSP